MYYNFVFSIRNENDYINYRAKGIYVKYVKIDVTYIYGILIQNLYIFIILLLFIFSITLDKRH